MHWKNFFHVRAACGLFTPPFEVYHASNNNALTAYLYFNSITASMSGYGVSHEVRPWMPVYGIIIQVVTTVLLAIRLLSRFHRSGGQLGIDDLLIAIGGILGMAMTIVVILGTVTTIV
jgi:hypothetical protein